MISARLGIRKRLQLVEDVQAKGFKVLNLRIPYSELLQSKADEPKEEKKKAKKKKSSAKKKSSKKTTRKK
jgi:prophage tail gpP-like protein